MLALCHFSSAVVRSGRPSADPQGPRRRATQKRNPTRCRTANPGVGRRAWSGLGRSLRKRRSLRGKFTVSRTRPHPESSLYFRTYSARVSAPEDRSTRLHDRRGIPNPGKFRKGHGQRRSLERAPRGRQIQEVPVAPPCRSCEILFPHNGNLQRRASGLRGQTPRLRSPPTFSLAATGATVAVHVRASGKDGQTALAFKRPASSCRPGPEVPDRGGKFERDRPFPGPRRVALAFPPGMRRSRLLVSSPTPCEMT